MGSTDSKADSSVLADPAPATRALTPRDRIRGSLSGLLIADALAMPVHWYYDPGAIRREYGLIEDFAPAKHPHVGSIMSVSNTGGAGRGGQSGRVIGDVINHGKHHLWGRPGIHYHHGMKAGENTLNALCARLVTRTLTAERGFSPAAFLDAYVAFMTTPGSHNDTYAETFHRMFFANWARGVAPAKCADDDGHNVASAGGLVMLPPVILMTALRTGSVDAARRDALAQVRLTHKSALLDEHVDVYAELLAKVALGADLRESVAAAGRRVSLNVPRTVELYGKDPDTRVVGGLFGSACYIQDSLRNILFLAYKYADRPAEGLVANTNVGGENCHRGAALGALLGAANGLDAWPVRWREGLAEKSAIAAEIEAFADAVLGDAAIAAAAPVESGAEGGGKVEDDVGTGSGVDATVTPAGGSGGGGGGGGGGRADAMGAVGVDRTAEL